jgi:hypothetical protein
VSDHSRTTPSAVCGESVPNGEGLGSGLTVAGPRSTTAAGRARLAGGDGTGCGCAHTTVTLPTVLRWRVTPTMSHYPDRRVTPPSTDYPEWRVTCS